MPETPDPVILYLSTLESPASRRVIGNDLYHVARICALGPLSDVRWHQLGVDTYTGVREALAASLAPSTANRRITAVRGVLRACWRLGQVPWDTQLRLLATLTPVKGRRVKKGRALRWPDVQRLLEMAGQEEGPETVALVAVMGCAGLRRAECAGLRWAGLRRRHDPRSAWFLTWLGKGNVERSLRLPLLASDALRAWQRKCPAREHVFRWRTGEAVYAQFKKVVRAAGLEPLSPHDMRRTFAATFLRSGGTIDQLQRAMGHRSIATTMKYDLRSDDEVQESMGLLDTLTASPNDATLRVRGPR